MGGAAPSSKTIEAHLAVQATIRSYQVRGHLAAQTDPLQISNMSMDAAKKLIIRSVEVHQSDMETVYQLPSTTFIGGTVSYFGIRGKSFLELWRTTFLP